MGTQKKNKGYLYVNLEKYDYKVEDIPLREYPRPSFKRDSYICLNGTWDLCISTSFDIPSVFDKKVVVPFAVESPLSGVNHLLEPDEYLYYKRIFILKNSVFPNRILLNCDGIDQTAWVFINKKEVGMHVGGYTKFSFDITDFVAPGENEILIRVQDLTDSSYHSIGKQHLETSGYFYSSSSGIYKTIWLEEVPSKYILSAKFTPLYDEKAVKAKIKTNEQGKVILNIDNQHFEVEANKEFILKLDEFKPWSINNPDLYNVQIIYGEDKVNTYFGLRKIEIKTINGNPAIYLNDKKIILNGVLDQGYYYLGGLTPKSYKDYEFDVLSMKEFGFNTLRKHIKIESDYYYYLCDTKGMLLIQDFVNGGDHNNWLHTVKPRVLPFIYNKPWNANNLKKVGRTKKESRDEFIKEAIQTMNDLWNHPSIIVYTIFNEGWGQFDADKMYKYCKDYDSSRLYDSASGWFETWQNDFYSIHAYTTPTRKRKDKRKYNRPYILSETGGRGFEAKGHFFYGKIWGQGYSKDKEDMNRNYEKLYDSLYEQIKSNTLHGVIYTQLSDIERESNGIFSNDRKMLKIDKDIIQKVNNKIKKYIDDNV